MQRFPPDVFSRVAARRNSKTGDHKTLFASLESLEKTKYYEVLDEKGFLHQFRFLNDVALNKSNPDVHINVLEYIWNGFHLESVLMVGNNLIFFSMWWIFFRQFETIGGWQINDMAASMVMLSGAYGISNVCFGGVKNLGLIILNGDLDPFMTQPKNLLLHLAGSKSRSKGWGHLFTAVILLILGGFKASSLPLILMLIVSGAIIFTSLGLIVHSLTFWLGSIESVSQKYLDSLFVFALYPTNIYSGLLQLVMFTLIPAGLIGYVPVELLRAFSWDKFAILIGCSLGFLGAACLVFHLGLKKYESGNKFGMRL